MEKFYVQITRSFVCDVPSNGSAIVESEENRQPAGTRLKHQDLF